jgi:hypothetical protein
MAMIDMRIMGATHDTLGGGAGKVGKIGTATETPDTHIVMP